MKRLLFSLILILFFVSFKVYSFPKKTSSWHRGTVVFLNGDSLRCIMKFTRKVPEGMLQIRRDNRIEILTVKDIRSFYFLDATKGKIRTFQNLAFVPVLSKRRHEVFIELIHDTRNFSILSHKTLGYSKRSIQLNPFRKKSVVTLFYLMDKRSSTLEPMSKEAAFQMMESKKEDIQKFLAGHPLKLRSLSDFILLVDFHDTLN